jgi:hypothetical protein
MQVHTKCPIGLFWALRGVRIVSSAGRSAILNSRMKSMLVDGQPLAFMDKLNQDRTFNELLVVFEGDPNPENVKAYRGVIKYLRWLYVSAREREDTYIWRTKVMAFPGMVSPLFLSLLGSSDLRALVIMAHFFAFFTVTDEVWWTKGVASREVQGLLTIIPKDWIWAMEWPLRQILKPGSLADSRVPDSTSPRNCIFCPKNLFQHKSSTISGGTLRSCTMRPSTIWRLRHNSNVDSWEWGWFRHKFPNITLLEPSTRYVAIGARLLSVVNS